MSFVFIGRIKELRLPPPYLLGRDKRFMFVIATIGFKEFEVNTMTLKISQNGVKAVTRYSSLFRRYFCMFSSIHFREKRDVLRSKTCVLRDSLLTNLFETNHGRTVYHSFIVVSVALCIHAFVEGYLKGQM